DAGVGNRGEPGQGPAPEQSDAFVVPGAPGDRGSSGAGICGGEFQCVGAKVISAAQKNSDPASRQPAAFPEMTNCLTGALQGGERFGLGAGIGVQAVGSDPKLGRAGARNQEHDQQSQLNRHDRTLAIQFRESTWKSSPAREDRPLKSGKKFAHPNYAAGLI